MPEAEGPLAAVDPDAVARSFAADPLELTDSLLDTTVIELQRRRNAFLASEAAKSLNKKAKAPATPAPSVEEQAMLDKPPGELTADDLFGEDG